MGLLLSTNVVRSVDGVGAYVEISPIPSFPKRGGLRVVI